jgi:hypothetical protein
MLYRLFYNCRCMRDFWHNRVYRFNIRGNEQLRICTSTSEIQNILYVTYVKAAVVQCIITLWNTRRNWYFFGWKISNSNSKSFTRKKITFYALAETWNLRRYFLYLKFQLGFLKLPLYETDHTNMHSVLGSISMAWKIVQ